MIIVKILAFVLLLGIIIGVHEFGHLIAAKLFKVHVYSFSLGMGPRLVCKKFGGTTYELRALPIGGYVSMAGEGQNEKDELIPYDRWFRTKKYWQKVIILLAGVFMNFVLAIGILSLVALTKDYSKPISNVVSEVIQDSPAYNAGLEPGDKIIQISNDKVKSFNDIQLALAMSDSEFDLIYIRGGQEYTTIIEKDSQNKIGIVGRAEDIKDVKWYSMPYFGFRLFIDNLTDFFRALKFVFRPGGLKMLSGPLGIAGVTSAAVQSGIVAYIHLIALLSTNVGIINLLPIPILDGGQVVIETIQKMTGKEINNKLKLILAIVSWLLILALTVVIFANDIVRMI